MSVWVAYRRLANELRCAIVSIVPILAVVYLLDLVLPEGSWLRMGAPWMVVAWMPAVAIAYLRLAMFRCPRCGRLFFRQGMWLWFICARSCMNCGLPKYQEVEFELARGCGIRRARGGSRE